MPKSFHVTDGSILEVLDDSDLDAVSGGRLFGNFGQFGLIRSFLSAIASMASTTPGNNDGSASTLNAIGNNNGSFSLVSIGFLNIDL